MPADFDELLFDYTLIRKKSGEQYPVSALLEFANSHPRNEQTGTRKTNVGRLDAIETATFDLAVLEEASRRYLIKFIRGGQGSAVGFRMRFPYDYTATLEAFATGNAVATQFPLYLTYPRPGPASHMANGTAHPDVRRILKPVVQVAKETNSFQLYEADGSTPRVPATLFKIYINGAEQPTGWSVNAKTGIITFTSPPGNGVVISWTGEFDVPVCFEGNTFAQHFDISSAAQYTLREMLGPELGLT